MPVQQGYTYLNHKPLTTIMGPIGMQEMIMLFIIILLLFGAKKLPELARGVGKSMGEFKKAREEFEYEITRSENEVTKKSNIEKPDSETETRLREVPGKMPRDS